MDDSKFEKLVEDALRNLPGEFSEKMDNLNLLIQDYPNEQQMSILSGRKEGNLLLGLYEGIPKTRRGSYGIGGPLPDKITIFKIPLLQISTTSEEIKRNVTETVIHEIGHHFGLTDEEIAKAKRGGVKY